MPATEQTWRNQKTLHVIFGVTALVMAAATVWMMLKDHNREWKDWQLKDRKKDAWMTQSRHDALAHQYAGEMRDYQQEIRELESEPIDPKLIDKFKQAVAAQAADAVDSDADQPVKPAKQAPALTKTALVSEPAAKDDPRFASLDKAVKAHEADVEKLAKLQSAEPVDADAVRQARNAVIAARGKVIAQMDKFIREAKRVEKTLVTEKKSINGERTAAVSELGIKIGQGAPADVVKGVQARIDSLDEKLADRTARIARARDYRMKLEAVVADIDAKKAAAAKELDAMKTELGRLSEQVYENTSNVGEWVTRLPILNALYSGNVRIEQNWLPDMTINYNFAQVARFDRCVTCHRAIAKTAPGTATEPLYPTVPKAQRERSVTLETPGEQPPQGATVLDVYGMQLTEEQMIQYADPTLKNVTVHFVIPETAAARAGIQAGDVLRSIDGSPMNTTKMAEQTLLTLVNWDSTVPVTLYRGLDHPFTAHPRLDLYLTDSSPHPQKDVGCTICHDGQGSGTEFKYTSHTPDNAAQQSRWAREYGWFDNHHWIFPMRPARFVESNCLKCHHDKASLQPSERFPDPPAPTVVEGWTLVEKFGCFGCHEIGGINGNATVGPDIRLEPNFHETAAQLLGQEGLSENERQMAEQLLVQPADQSTRRQLYESLQQSLHPADGASNADPQATAALAKLTNLLKDVESPGTYRKVGPSLRHIEAKVEYDWLYAWIRKPSDFRPTTQMPQFFGLHEHLSEPSDDAELAESQRFEPIEIRALAEYLLTASDDFEYVPRAEGITETPSADRGEWVFQSRGCLACHTHGEFPESHADQGPDLTRLRAKLDTPKGRDWLYSWVRDPQKYHARTVMPNVFLEPIAEKDAQGKPTGKVTDPAADVVAFLLEVEPAWRPEDVPSRDRLSAEEKAALTDLALEWLASDAIPRSRAESYLLGAGIPESMEPKLKADERLLVGLNDENRVKRQLEFVGRRTISKYGCFGCHDIPGFEDAKPIGTALADWGRKETSKLAFENIHKFLETHGVDPKNPEHPAKGKPIDKHAAVGAASKSSADAEEDATAHSPSAHGGHLDPKDFSPEQSYFIQALNSHGRDGFLWQKLRHPRSFDYKTTQNKGYNERLRMPLFNFNDQQRQAVMTFVLGLVKEPPADKYLFRPDPRQQAIADGRRVIEQFNCGGCHTIAMEQWEFDFAEGEMGEATEVVDFPFLAPRFTEKEIAASKAKDYRGMLHASIHGQPVLDPETGAAGWVDEDRQPISKEELLEAEADEGETIPVFYLFTLWRNALLDGGVRYRGIDELMIPADREHGGPANGAAYPAWGGDLARYLSPKVLARGRETNPQLEPKAVWAWLPPPLMDEGSKVQPDWLHGFLMDPHEIRPAVVMRMPNFHMSSDEAAKLVDFFAASSGAAFPYEYKPEQRASYLAKLHTQRDDPLGDAMKIVASGNYCVKCHAVADFTPQGDPTTFGPNLADVYRRLRPEFTRDWIANPVRILPYTGMPVNIPYRPDDPHLGGVGQDLFPGTSIEQLQGLVDLLMNFDSYARSNTAVAPLVEAAAAAAASGQPPAEENPAAGESPVDLPEEEADSAQ
jgi:cytochrome c2